MAEGQKSGSTKKRILLIDDDHAVTQMLSMLLRTRNYDVCVASTGEEAFRSVSPETDLVLLDLVLPDHDGFDICRKFKAEEQTAHIPIIILSARLLSEDIVEGLYLGADDYLTKPFEFEELVARMEAVMRRGSFFQRGKLMSESEGEIIRELRKIIDEELVVPFFQPIFSVDPFEVVGFEALCRPTTKSVLANPEILFKTAINYGLYQELEMVSWRKALEYASTHLDGKKLFLNCNPFLVEGPKFNDIKDLLLKSNVKASNLVLEITERSEVSDYKTFYDHLARFREYGFSFAVDDVGGGYASLESIVETKPEVVKIDRHIVCALNEDKFKQSIVRFIVSFCKENNIMCIAEGIETKAEFDTIKKLGVDSAQGYFLFKPAPKIDMELISKIDVTKEAILNLF